MKKLTQQDYIEAARILDCEVSDIMAVAEVESRGDGFQSDGMPKILFERHIFRRYTNGKYNTTHPHLSGPQGGYKGGAAEWKRFQEAARLDKQAAMLSISMGKFQIMGFNFSLAGYKNVEQFHNAMFLSEGEQLKAFCRFIKNRKLDDELRENRWAAFASGYNGPAYKQNRYDEKMARADAKFERQGVDQESGDILEIDWPLPSVPKTDYAPDASVAVPPAPVPSSPPVTTEKAPDLSGEIVGTVVEFAKRPGSLKSLRTFLGMLGLGSITAIEGFVEKNQTFLFIAIAVVVLFSLLYFLRQWHLDSIHERKQ